MQIKMQHGIDSNKLLNTVYVDTFVLYFTDCCIVFEHLVSSITNSWIVQCSLMVCTVMFTSIRLIHELRVLFL